MHELPESRLPEDLRFLVRKYPREAWNGHANLGDLAQFWLSRHDMFRELGGAIGAATAGFREQRSAAGDFIGWTAPRLQFFLTQLEHHHHVEDHHYFPVFRAAEQRLGRGFDLLDRDHDGLHRHLHDTAEAANRMISAIRAGEPAERAVHAYADQVDSLRTAMLAHLRDEEDLIIPLILDRSEAALGVG